MEQQYTMWATIFLLCQLLLLTQAAPIYDDDWDNHVKACGYCQTGTGTCISAAVRIPRNRPSSGHIQAEGPRTFGRAIVHPSVIVPPAGSISAANLEASVQKRETDPSESASVGSSRKKSYYQRRTSDITLKDNSIVRGDGQKGKGQLQKPPIAPQTHHLADRYYPNGNFESRICQLCEKKSTYKYCPLCDGQPTLCRDCFFFIH